MKLAPVLFLLAAALACSRAPRRPAPAPPSESLGPGVLGLAPRFQPPADGLLTDEQVESFLKVRRAAKGRTDAETARALGVRPEEIAWTRARVIETLAAIDEKRVREAATEEYGRALAAMKAARGSASSPAAARALEDQIAVLERERATVRRDPTSPPALARNVAKVAARRAELEAVAP